MRCDRLDGSARDVGPNVALQPGRAREGRRPNQPARGGPAAGLAQLFPAQAEAGPGPVTADAPGPARPTFRQSTAHHAGSRAGGSSCRTRAKVCAALAVSGRSWPVTSIRGEEAASRPDQRREIGGAPLAQREQLVRRYRACSRPSRARRRRRQSGSARPGCGPRPACSARWSSSASSRCCCSANRRSEMSRDLGGADDPPGARARARR